MSKILITLIIWGALMSCTTLTTCGPSTLFTKGKEYCSKETFLWFEKPEPAFKAFKDKDNPTDCEIEATMNVFYFHMGMDPAISEGCE